MRISDWSSDVCSSDLKLFGPDGFKLSDEVEQEIEARIDNGVWELALSHQLGRAQRLDESGHGRYIEFVKSSFPRGLRLDGLKVVVDCANRSEERRVGKECVSTCRSRWSP